MNDYSKMSDFEINKLVAKHLGKDIMPDDCQDMAKEGFGDVIFTNGDMKDYCNNPADAWLIIVKHGIGIIPFKNGLSESWDLGKGLINGTVKDKNPLRAAMIVFLMMKDAEK